MPTKKILVTGGAGFIGSHLVDKLLSRGHDVTVFDNLDPQVHGDITNPPGYLAKNIHFVKGDVRYREQLKPVLEDAEVVYHLAATVGVAQSMYQIEKFYTTNTTGTAVLFDLIVNRPNSVQKVVVASSMSIYGEGTYHCKSHGTVEPQVRLKRPKDPQDWEITCPICHSSVHPVPTPETKRQDCTTIYALTKKDQEDMAMLVGKTYGIDTTALRLFGTYGSRQALSNPYTGVCAIFSTALLTGNSPLIYEDGLQTRDLVHVNDICQALLLSMEKPEARKEIFNVGTGHAVSILHVAKTLGKLINPEIHPSITHNFRAGDVRHITADITKISEKLGYQPQHSFESGMKELVAWVKEQKKVEDRSNRAQQELEKKGLLQ
jgi:dTDP-L-rhamnose 4-epimerase